MRAGMLNQRIDFQELVEVRDATGGIREVGNWVTYYENIPASIEPLRGEELYSAQRLNPEITHRVRIRYLPGIGSHLRIRYADPDAGDRFFRIVSVYDPYEMRKELQMVCSELVGRSR